MAGWWAEVIEAELSQGDVLVGIAFTVATHPFTPLVKGTVHGGPAWIESQWKPDANGRGHALSAGRRGAALVLSHSCDLDKARTRSRVLVCPMPALTEVQEEHRPAIIAQQKRSALPLLEVPRDLGDCYGDLSHILTIDRRVLDACERIASMTSEGRRRLKLQLAAYFARIPMDALVPDEDED